MAIGGDSGAGPRLRRTQSTGALEAERRSAADPAKVLAWKRIWGYEPAPPPNREFADQLNQRIGQRWKVDRSAASDQLSGQAFSAQRRAALLQAAGTHYLAEEYGLRTAKDERPLGEQRGMRVEHQSSTSYLRDNPGEIQRLFTTLLERSTVPATDRDKVLFVNSPTVVDKVRLVYGNNLFPASRCPNAGCAGSAPGVRGSAGSALREEAPTTPCPECRTALLPYPAVHTLAPGVFAVVTELAPAMPDKEVFGDQRDVATREGQLKVLESAMKSLGATPSSYQAFKAVHAGGELALAEAPLGAVRTLQRMKPEALATQFDRIGPDHPMHAVAGAAVSLAGALPALLAAPAAPGALPSAGAARYAARRKYLDGQVARLADARGLKALKPGWDRLDAELAAAQGHADGARWPEADAALDRAQALAAELRTQRMDRDPLLANALAQLEALVTAMPAMAGDAPRFTKLFDLMTDELHIILAQLKPYDNDSFVQQALAQLKTRAPALAGLRGVEARPHLVSSGMDALSSGVAAARAALGAQTPASMPGKDAKADYFETPALLDHAGAVRAEGNIIVGNLNPSTPTTPPSSVDTVVQAVRARLQATAQPPQKIALVLDITIEKGRDDGSTDLDQVFSDPEIAKALEDGRLCITLCKSYQKYAGLGAGKVMAGNTTVIAKPGEFDATHGFMESVDQGLDFMANDESQLMTHLVATTGAQELALERRAAANAGTLAAMTRSAAGNEIAVFNAGLPFVRTFAKTLPLAGPDGGEMSFADAMLAMGVEKRDSFGFQNSSCLDIGDGVRVNTGQESEEGLTEKFHAIARLGLQPLADHEAAKATNLRERARVQGMKDAYNAGMKAWREAPNDAKPPKPAAVTAVLPRPLDPPRAAGFAEMKGALDADLQGLLAGGAGGAAPFLPGDALAVKIRKVGEAAPPTVTDLRAHPDTMVEQLGRGPEAAALGTINSKVASYLLLAKVMPRGGDAETAELRQLHEAFIEGGMARVTPETRAKVISNWMGMALPTLKDDPDPKAAGTRVVRMAARLPYREDRAKAFLNASSDAEHAALPAPLRKVVTGALVGKLDIESKVAVFRAAFAGQQWNKAEDCLDELEAHVQRLLAGERDGVRADTLASGGGRAGAASAPQALSPGDLAAIRAKVAECTEMMTDVLLERLPGPAKAAEAEATGELDLAREFLGPPAPALPQHPKPRRVLADQVAAAVERSAALLPRLRAARATATHPRQIAHLAQRSEALAGRLDELRTLLAQLA